MAALIKRLRQRFDDRGAEMVEFALIAPLLLLVIAGIAEFGFLFQSFEVTTNAAREGARLAVLPGYDVNNYEAPKARVADYITSAHLQGTYTTAVTPETIDLGGGVTVDGVKVAVTYHHPLWIIRPIVSMLNRSFASSITYTAAARMRSELPAVVP